MKYQFVEQHKQEFPVVVMCQVLEVSESGFYAWRKRPTCQRRREDAQLTSHIRQVFENHQERYGSPRIQVELRDQGRSLSRKRVARLMREAGLCARGKRRRMITTRRDASHPVAPNILERDFTATEPNSKWVTDITSIPTTQGWLYLAVILDVSSRAVVGWSMSSNCDEALAENALNMAVARRHPKAGLLHHSDRGCQYTSTAYRKRLEQAAMIVSMSRKGNCWDNAVMESFFGSRHARSAWGVRSIRLMSKPGSRSSSTWKPTTIARGVIQRSDISARSPMNRLESNEQKEIFDV